MGSPLALSQSVTMGIVSNTEMIMPQLFWPFNRMTLDGEDVGSIVRWIGHDAPIFGGNSGGPLINLQGEIVGVNEISMGLAGAIPADLAREVAFAIIKDGRVKRSWIGLDVQPLLKSSKRRDRRARGRHDRRVAGGQGRVPARRHRAVRSAAEDVTVRFAEEMPLFNQAVMRLPLGKPVDVVVLAEGRAEDAARRARGARERRGAESTELPLVGITASNLTAWSAKELKRDSRDGVACARRPARRSGRRRPACRSSRTTSIVEVDGKPRQGRRRADARGRGADEGARRAGVGARRRSIAAGSGCSRWSRSGGPASRIPGSRRARPGFRCRCRC